mmetsp:Transcript_6025/g.18159  ORF Transcript_6025/g.18159 Transcript_6025/m.18159 type:complete len:330 (-) Transcript_6025:126-1115(-)|eukprot:CAMPEP_0198727648 /NCGR_PEP_ID=MMETSP1475-20131203/4646_1 /TAXON_ID= ORGANISM="Unidentified sp., Strain CCMP1999" /NCGR_SAMPLE_ID=MMETSP1475 /ASSEMBLY_ACC=CAM_ASM_001111 /LENGTH=329 /DNA_ID=CAMNT_0044489725 /DNA_START=79 /DNA_END=1068 /DNA_ORIENTATION=+
MAFVGGWGKIPGGRGGNGNNSCGRRPASNSFAQLPERAMILSMAGTKRKQFDGYVGDDILLDSTGRQTAFITSDLDSATVLSSSTKPVVVILSWMGASHKNVEKYVEFYRQKGYDVYFYLNNMAHAMVPIESKRQASRVLETISSIPSDRPVFVHAFSIGTGIYGYVLDMMKKQKRNADNIAGVIFDSGPSMIFPADVAKALYMMCPNVSKKVWNMVANSFFSVTQARRNFSVAEEALKKLQLPKAPQLYMYSLDDKIINEVGENIGHFIEANKKVGAEVFSKVWEKSKHATHMRYHPEEYMDNVSQFLHRCLENHNAVKQEQKLLAAK